MCICSVTGLQMASALVLGQLRAGGPRPWARPALSSWSGEGTSAWQSQQRDGGGCARIHNIAATGFNNQAEKYESVRPSYPPEAVQHVIKVANLGGPGRKRVLDVAAGTGKFTRLLLQHPNLEVTAIEPVANMRKVFMRVLPATVPVLEGVASDIPFPDNFFDAITVAQAFHWFDNVESVREMHRVLKPGGALVLLWNMEDNRSDWVKAVRDAYEAYDGQAPQYRKGHWPAVFQQHPQLFGPKLSTAFFHHSMLVSKAEVWSRVLSKSYVASLPTTEQQRLKEVVLGLLEQHDQAFSHQQQQQGQGERRALQPIVSEVAWGYANK